jgi:hypothetical protein
VRTRGYDKTVGSAWGGTGSFRDLLAKGLPEEIRLNNQPPYYVYDSSRAVQNEQRNRIEARRPEPQQAEVPAAVPGQQQRTLLGPAQPAARANAPQSGPPAQAQRGGPQAPAQSEALSGQPGLPPRYPQPYAGQRPGEGATAIQQSIARIHEASQAPTLSPPDYRTLFDVMAQEISANGPAGLQTIGNIVKRAQELGVEVRPEDARFVLDVVGEADPWFVQGVSASLFASRFRNFVVARCRSQGLNLSADELDLIEAWFAAPAATQPRNTPTYGAGQPQGGSAGANGGMAPKGAPGMGAQGMGGQMGSGSPASGATAPAAMGAPNGPDQGQQVSADGGNRWWNNEDQRRPMADQSMGQGMGSDEFPRIIRTRLRG